jgi:hypothetical protein
MANGLQYIVPAWEGVPKNVGALSTVRSGGVSLSPYDDGHGGGGLNLGMHVGDDMAAVLRNRELLRAVLPAEPAWLNQVHGATVVDAAALAGVPDADACIATAPDAVCVIQTADCLPVLFCDTAGKTVGAAHAGWRGMAAGVLQNTVHAMRKAGAGEITAWMGPAIGPACFEVGEEVRQVFVQREAAAAEAFVRITERPDKFLADIYHLARLCMRQAGVERVFGGGLCTVSDRDKFYSFRRDKTTGRMASCIWLNAA